LNPNGRTPAPQTRRLAIEESEQDAALLQLLQLLRNRRYAFVTPTPASHARVLARPGRDRAQSLRDIFGWNLPFVPDEVDAELLSLAERAGAIRGAGPRLVRSRFRVASLFGDLYLHSEYPTENPQAVFFGPDSYRFARLIHDELARAGVCPGAHIVDIGTGAGVGAMVAAKLVGSDVTGTDVNPLALRLAAINARAARVTLHTVTDDDLERIERPIDLALANPPYLIDAEERLYRDGGAKHGGETSLRMAEAAVERLAPCGRLILYTGSAIVDGNDELRAALVDLAEAARCTLRYEEIDPDVFGEELERPAYGDVDRIAVVSAVFSKL